MAAELFAGDAGPAAARRQRAARRRHPRGRTERPPRLAARRARPDASASRCRSGGVGMHHRRPRPTAGRGRRHRSGSGSRSNGSMVERRARHRRAHGRGHDHRPSCRARRLRRAAPLRAARRRARPATVVPRPDAPVPPRRLDGQGELRAVASRCRGPTTGRRCRHGARRRQRSTSCPTTAARAGRRAAPGRPFLLIGQTTTADPTRSPAGTESLWMYTHVPQDVTGRRGRRRSTSPGGWRGAALDEFVERMEDRIVDARARVPLDDPRPPRAGARRPRTRPTRASSAATSAAARRSCTSSSCSGRCPASPAPRRRSPGLYLASSSAHPGGSVHGACGANAARAALVGSRVTAARRVAAASRRCWRPGRSSARARRRHR